MEETQPSSHDQPKSATGQTASNNEEVLTEDEDEQFWGMILHLSAFTAILGIPFANILAPLIIWQVQKDEMPFLDKVGKEAVNFQIAVTVYSLVGVLLTIILIGIPLLIGLGVAAIILTVIAAIKANEGKCYRFPYIFRVIS